MFTHGTCSNFDTDSSKCEIITSHADPCKDSSRNNEKSNNASEYHICCCVSVYLTEISPTEFSIFQSEKLSFFHPNPVLSEYIKRIERPPIFIS